MKKSPGARVRSAAVLLLLLPAASSAQSTLALHFSAGGGVAIPSGSNGDELRTGYQIQAALEAGRPRSAIAFRLEGLFARFGSKIALALPCAFGVPCPEVPTHERTVAGTLDMVVSPSGAASTLVPYLMAGVGGYRQELSAPGGVDVRSGTDLGANVGAGLRVPRLHVFAEVRAHFVRNASSYLPIAAGVRF